jgi:predicted small secreted protein
MMTSLTFPVRAAILASAATLIVLGLSACNTISGAGQDIKSTGKAIERSAEASK